MSSASFRSLAAAYWACFFIVCDHGADKDVRIGSDSHYCLDQPAAAASVNLVKSRNLPGFTREQAKEAVYLAEWTRSLEAHHRPHPAVFSNSIFSPGRMPRCAEAHPCGR